MLREIIVLVMIFPIISSKSQVRFDVVKPDSNEIDPAMAVTDSGEELTLLSPRSILSSVELSRKRFERKNKLRNTPLNIIKPAAVDIADKAADKPTELRSILKKPAESRSLNPNGNETKKSVKLLVPNSHFSAEKVSKRKEKNRRKSVKRLKRILRRTLRLLRKLEGSPKKGSKGRKLWNKYGRNKNSRSKNYGRNKRNKKKGNRSKRSRKKTNKRSKKTKKKGKSKRKGRHRKVKAKRKPKSSKNN